MLGYSPRELHAGGGEEGGWGRLQLISRYVCDDSLYYPRTCMVIGERLLEGIFRAMMPSRRTIVLCSVLVNMNEQALCHLFSYISWVSCDVHDVQQDGTKKTLSDS